MLKIVENLHNIKERIANAETQYGRELGSVKLVGVTKKQPMGKLKTAADEGLKDFGENHLQEALAKLSRLKQYGIQWHFLGPIQSNKTQAIAQYFQWVHSIDRAKIALRLSEQMPESVTGPLNILIQVNVDDEDNKAGVAFEELPMVLQFISELPKLRMRGLMAIPAIRREFDEQRKPFSRLREAYEKLKLDYPTMDTLSMGMSHDFEAAIAEGSTMVRIGAAIFGERGI